MQEIEDYGQPGEHKIPEGEGGGYIWKLFSIVRLEESGDGVYLEMEAVALSREIPGALRLVVDPIVRRVSRNSLLILLQQTEEAARGSFVSVARSAGVPASAEQNCVAFQQEFRIRASIYWSSLIRPIWNTACLE